MRRTYLLIIVVLALSYTQSSTLNVRKSEQRRPRLKFELDIRFGCEVIGFPNATLNECGYCTDGDTGLNSNYGKDCLGVCHGSAVIDCEGICAGEAYIDECTGKCVFKPEAEHSRAWNSSTKRDCRGLCLQSSGSGAAEAAQGYALDECRICRLQTSVSSRNDSSSESRDCNGRCQLPGLAQNILVCDQCVRSSERSSVLDECGNCLSEGHPCSCDRDPTKCGCIDPNNCYVSKTLFPGAIPINTPTNVSIMGYFFPYAKQLFCIVRQSRGEHVTSFPVEFLHKNRTTVQCPVQLDSEGEYLLGLGFRRDVFITPPRDLLGLYAYNAANVNISLVGPSQSLTNEAENELTVSFSDLSDSIPPIPLRCRFLYESGEFETGPYGTKQNSCIWPKSTQRSKSQIVKIFPTFDGQQLFPAFVEHRIESTAPAIFSLSSFVAEDGLAIVVNFDKSVDLVAIEQRMHADGSDEEGEENEDNNESLEMCDYLFAPSTVEHLAFYGLHSCRWATRVQLVIQIRRPVATDSIEVELKPNILQEFDQRFARPNIEGSANITKLSTALNWWSYEPLLAISGPQQVPLCGEFALAGQFSSPRSTHEVDFRWSVAAEGLSRRLKQFVDRMGRSTNLLLNSDMFEFGLEYEFTLKATIQARRQSIEAKHRLVRVDYPAPLLTLHHTRQLHSSPIAESDNVTLFVDIKTPDCVHPAQQLVVSWTTNDPRFRFPVNDARKRYSAHFTIEPFAVPSNLPTLLTANAFVGLYQNQTIIANYELTVARAPLKASLMDGVQKMSLGANSGVLRLFSGWPKTEAAKRGRRVVYQWSCHDEKTGQPCYFNFGTRPAIGHTRDAILFSGELQNHPVIDLNSTWFMPGAKYLIGLQVFDANNSRLASETEYSLLNVESGNGPQIFIGPVLIKGQYVVPYNSRFSTFLIPSGTHIIIRGRAAHSDGIEKISWDSQTFRFRLNWSNKKIDERETLSELFIHEDNLLPYGVYNLKMVACTANNACSTTEISLMAVQSASMCQLIFDPYVELELNVARVERCSLAPNAAPWTYQVFVEAESLPGLIPVNSPQLSPVMTFVGTPAFSSPTGENQVTRLGVRVCDRFDTCTMHYAAPIGVKRSSNLTDSALELTKMAKRIHKTGDFMNALSLLNVIFLKPVEQSQETPLLFAAPINETISIGVAALQRPGLTLTRGHYDLAVNTFSFAIQRTGSLRQKRKLMALIERFLDKAESYDVAPSVNSLRNAFSAVGNAHYYSEFDRLRTGNATISDPNYLRDMRKSFNRIRRSAAAQLPLGNRMVLIAERTDYRFGEPRKLQSAITELVHLRSVFDASVRGAQNGTGNSTINGRIQFGDEIKQIVDNPDGWNCGQKLPCTTVVYSTTLFPNEIPYPLPENAHLLTSALDISVHAPRTGAEQPLKGLFKAAIFELTVLGNITHGGPDYVTKCHYFDEELQEWRMDDIHPLGIAYGAAGCWTGHLTTFIVMRTIFGLNADYILGVFVACLMGVLVFGMMLCFYIQRKREHEKANESGVHKTVESSTVHPTKKKPSTVSNHQRMKSSIVNNGHANKSNKVEVQTKTIMLE